MCPSLHQRKDVKSTDKLIIFTKRFLDWNEIYFTLMLLTDGAGNGPTSKKKLKSQKKKKRKRGEEEEEEEFPTVKDVCSNTEDIRADHVGTEHQQKQLKTEQRGRQHSNKLCNNNTRTHT